MLLWKAEDFIRSCMPDRPFIAEHISIKDRIS